MVASVEAPMPVPANRARSRRISLAAVLLVTAAGCASTQTPATLPPRPAVPDGWTTVQTAAGDLEMTLPPYIDAFDTEAAIHANEPPDPATGQFTFSLMGTGPWTVVDLLEPGETAGEWIERVVLSGVPAERRTDTTSEQVLLPSGVGHRVRTTVDAGTVEENVVLVWAVPTQDRVGYLVINGSPAGIEEHAADAELIAQLMRFAHGKGRPAGQ